MKRLSVSTYTGVTNFWKQSVIGPPWLRDWCWVCQLVVCEVLRCCCVSEHVTSVYGSESVNTFSPSFRLDVAHLLDNLEECDQTDEVSQVIDWHSCMMMMMMIRVSQVIDWLTLIMVMMTVCLLTVHVYNKLCYCRGTMRAHCQLKSCEMLHKCSKDCIWKRLQVVNDLQGHSRSLPLLPFYRPYTISY